MFKLYNYVKPFYSPCKLFNLQIYALQREQVKYKQKTFTSSMHMCIQHIRKRETYLKWTVFVGFYDLHIFALLKWQHFQEGLQDVNPCLSVKTVSRLSQHCGSHIIRLSEISRIIISYFMTCSLQPSLNINRLTKKNKTDFKLKI